jgi:hypothetical protein
MPSEATKPSLRGSAALAVIVLCAALVVVVAADRPSFLTAQSHFGFFPHWMAGPLGGLWPGLSRGAHVVKWLFTGALAAMYGAYLVALRYARTPRARWVVAAVVAVHAVMLLSPPLTLTDVFNYINYGRMGVLHHLNPYTTIPVLEPHSDPSFFLSKWHKLMSPYGPLFTLLTYALVPLGIAGSLWALKGLVMAASLGTLLLVWKCARLLGRDPVRAVVLVGLNPLVLLWGLGGVHNDFLTAFLLVLAFWLLLRAGAPGVSPEVGAVEAGVADAAARDGGVLAGAADGAAARAKGRLWELGAGEVAAGVALAAAVALKASAGILVPVLLAGLLRDRRRFAGVAAGLAAGAAALGAASLAAFGPHLPSLGTQGRVVIPMSLPNVVGLALGQGGETETMRTLLVGVLALAVLGCGVLAWRRRDALTASGWATVVLLVTLSWVLPWYVLWVLPLAALSHSRALRRTTLAIGVWLILTWMPLATAMDNALHIRPTATPLGRAHEREVERLLN